MTTRCRATATWNGLAEWIAAARRVLDPNGSLFLNVGAKPTDPWISMEVAMAARPHLELQNTIHWIKSIAIGREAAGAAVDLDRDLAVGHYKPINSPRFVNDCHEFIFHFTPEGRTPLDRRAIGVPYQDASNIDRWQTGGSNLRCRGNTWFIPYRRFRTGRRTGRIQPRSRRGYPIVLQAARRVARDARDGPFSRARQHRRCRRPTRPGVHRRRTRRALPRRSHRAHPPCDRGQVAVSFQLPAFS